jgi:heme/copper-type cytochrome/quinol oxidase subunit 3
MLGVLLFIVSEVFAFLSVFWAYFHSSLSPSIEIGGSWPPLGINPLDPFAIPLLNTFLLLSSGYLCLFTQSDSHKCEIFYSFVLFSCSSLPFSSPRVNPINRF